MHLYLLPRCAFGVSMGSIRRICNSLPSVFLRFVRGMARSAIRTTGVVVAVVPPILANNGTIGSLICLSIQEMVIRTIFDECSVLGVFLCLSILDTRSRLRLPLSALLRNIHAHPFESSGRRVFDSPCLVRTACVFFGLFLSTATVT